MGATLDYQSVKSSTSKEAISTCVSYLREEYGNNPYSGTLATLTDWQTFPKDKFNNRDEFHDWVEENGDKWDGYVWQSEEDIFELCGWCAE